MKRLWLGVAAGLIGLGLLSGVSAAVTIHFLYKPAPAGAPVPTAAASASGSSPALSPADSTQSTGAVATSSTEVARPQGQQTSPLPVGASLIEGALALVRDLPNQGQFVSQSLVKLAPQPIRANLLPGGNDQTGTVLVWTNYTRPDGSAGNGPLLIQYQNGRPMSITGPLVPPGGYTRPELTLLDEKSRRLPPSAYQGKPLILIAPRRPEAGLGYTLTSLQETLAPHGVTVALVIDVGAPDWISAARKEGFTGPIWRLKGQLDRIPVVTPGQLDGAIGLMLDKDGYAVGSLPLLNPTTYDLFDKEPAQIAVQVLQAYGLVK